MAQQYTRLLSSRALVNCDKYENEAENSRFKMLLSEELPSQAQNKFLSNFLYK